MARLSQKVILNLAAVSTSPQIPFDMPDGADGVVADIIAENGASSPSFTFTLYKQEPGVSGGLQFKSLIASAAVVGNGLLRIGALPLVVAQTNIFANEVMGPQGMFQVSRGAGQFDLRVVLTFYKS